LLRDFGLGVNLTGVINAKRSGEISINELIRVINDTFLSVEVDYWTLVATIENLELQQTALEVAKDLQRRNEIQVEVGVLPLIAVTQAKSEVAARKVDVLSAENLVDEISDRLKNKLLLPLVQNIVPVDTPEKEFKSFDENSVLKQSLSNRPEVKQAQLNIDNKESTKKFYSNQRLPRLSVQGVLEFQGLSGEENENQLTFGNNNLDDGISQRFSDFSDSFDQISDGDFINWSIVGVFSYPIFNWEARGEYVKAKADYNRSIVEYDKIIDDVNLEVRSALREIENSQERIQAAEVSVELRKQVVINEEVRLNVGIGTTRELLEAQRDLVDARVSQIRAIADYNIALARLDRARGTIIRNKGIIIE
jgi:outer membrane protein TolC